MVNTMENAEEVMQILDRFTRLKQKEIPKELDEYLQYVAKTGDTVFKWASLKYLFREKLLNVIKNFHDTTPRVDEIPQYPNVDPFNYESMKSSLLERMELFNAAPFTVQRLCELLIDPRKQYSRIDKFMRALEKNILVVSTIEPGRKRTESENGDSLDSVVNGDLSLDVNVDIDMENESLFTLESQNGSNTNGNGNAASTEVEADCENSEVIVAKISNNKKKEEKLTPTVLQKENNRCLDEDIQPNPKKAKLELDASKNIEKVEKCEDVSLPAEAESDSVQGPTKVDSDNLAHQIKAKEEEQSGDSVAGGIDASVKSLCPENLKEILTKEGNRSSEKENLDQHDKLTKEIEEATTDNQEEVLEKEKKMDVAKTKDKEWMESTEEEVSLENDNEKTEDITKSGGTDCAVLSSKEKTEEAVEQNKILEKDLEQTDKERKSEKVCKDEPNASADTVYNKKETKDTAKGDTICESENVENEKPNSSNDLEEVVSPVTTAETSSTATVLDVLEQVIEDIEVKGGVVQMKPLKSLPDVPQAVTSPEKEHAVKLFTDVEKEDESKNKASDADISSSSTQKPQSDPVIEQKKIKANDQQGNAKPVEEKENSSSVAKATDSDELKQTDSLSSKATPAVDIEATPAIKSSKKPEDVPSIAPVLTLNDQPMEDTSVDETTTSPAGNEVIMTDTGVSVSSGGSTEMATEMNVEPSKDEAAGMEVDDTSQEAMDQ